MRKITWSSNDVERIPELEGKDASEIPLNAQAEHLGADLVNGLSAREAEERLAKFGANVIPKIKSSLYRVYIAPLLNWLISIYLISSTILAFLAFFFVPDMWGQVTLWLLAMAVNVTIAIIQQSRAQTKIEALEKLSAPRCNVVRDGRLKDIPAGQLVPGDVVKINPGDKVPADARIITSSNLRVNEASLTGESREVEKSENNSLENEATHHSRTYELFLGTYVTAGSATILVTETGADTQLGKISKSLERLNVGEIPLRQKINRLAKYLAIGVLLYLGLSLTHNLFYLYSTGQLFVDGVLNIQVAAWTVARSLIAAMSVTPINIPLLTTIILLTGVLVLAGHKVIIRNLSAVESLGRVSVVCSDKTGTITKNEMTVKWICIPSIRGFDQLFQTSGVGFQPSGVISSIQPEVSLEALLGDERPSATPPKTQVETDTSLELLLVSGVLNNDATIVEEMLAVSGKSEGELVYRIFGGATDASILTLFKKSGLELDHYRSRFKEVCNYPFESRLKRMTRVFKDDKVKKYVVFTKGATEVLLPRCTRTTEKAIAQASPLSDKDKSLIQNKVGLFAAYGNRVISFAFRYIDSLPPRELGQDAIERDMTYLGFVAIIDPPREGVLESVCEAESAGIKPIMITGDSLETARSIAQQVRIYRSNDLAVEGKDLGSITSADFMKASVFARVSPENKMKIVECYQEQKKVVAMTGDGVNDAPAISMADVGISMGTTGTDVAKETADMIVADDSFSSIIAGIREGRGLFQKIRSLVFYYVAINFAESLVYVGSSFIPGFYLVSAWQTLYILLTTHSIPPLLLIIDQLSRDVMKEKPRDSEEIFNKRVIGALLLFSIFAGLAFYASYFWTLDGVIPVFDQNKLGYIPTFNTADPTNPLNWAQAKGRTILYATILVAECTLIVSLRRINKSIFRTLKEDNYWIIWPFIILPIVANLVLMYVPFIQTLLLQWLGINLQVIQLTTVDWIVAIILGLMPIAILELYKKWIRGRGSFF
ncbi:MAG TPA: cation-transporting P-type ATPase [Candidatus Bathyarchaeia archaeon]|nr:cation-transporting P-type ATPase [Candidatus Bathyarchaeia archaeon]